MVENTACRVHSFPMTNSLKLMVVERHFLEEHDCVRVGKENHTPGVAQTLDLDLAF